MPAEHAQSASPKQLLDARHLRPRKRFGQNFLTDLRVARRIAAAVPPASYVLEIGGGTGTLTAALLERADAVTTLEIDRDLCAILEERFGGAPRARVLNADVLHYDLAGDLRGRSHPRVIAGNLPYYITTPILELVFDLADEWDRAIFMVQQEYARRLTARPGSKAYSSLTVFASYFARTEKLFDVGAAGFFPAPSVASTVLAFEPRAGRARMAKDERLLLWLVRAAFSHRRKTFVNSVLAALRGGTPRIRKEMESALQVAGLARTIRGERLALEDFCRVADTLVQRGVMEHQWTTPSTS